MPMTATTAPESALAPAPPTPLEARDGDTPAFGATPRPARRERLMSLDAFRGLTVAGMLLVNNPGTWGAIYQPLEHAPWNGWTPTDLIFPFFLFIVGITTHLSLAQRRARGDSDGVLVRQILRRGALIFLCGFALSLFPGFTWLSIAGHPDATFVDRVVHRWEHVRIMGVLQRIGVAYTIAALLSFRASLAISSGRPRARARSGSRRHAACGGGAGARRPRRSWCAGGRPRYRRCAPIRRGSTPTLRAVARHGPGDEPAHQLHATVAAQFRAGVDVTAIAQRDHARGRIDGGHRPAVCGGRDVVEFAHQYQYGSRR